ncbi:serine/threonine-protein phosphatase 6 regulatory subunit 3-like [Tubulanus polymorphus]|uniref:serine/threonine-protein phosphatase 6 regulatory subunit 3-like n=1 Tax=Tubulanus polymorphus TaxID=672921 RepID=UPI003DA28A94
MFWKFTTLVSTHIDTVLDKEDFTLQELMNEDDILQETKAQNQKLLDVLLTTETLNELVSMIIDEPPADCDEQTRFKYPNTACELLTSDIEQMNEALSTNPDLLNKMYSFLEQDHTLNPLLASFVSKVFGLLLTRKSERMVEFLKSKKNFIENLLKHIGTSAIMDLLLRLITCIDTQPEDEDSCRNNILMWLNNEKLIQKLVALINPIHPEDKHVNASQALCDVIRLSRDLMSQLQEVADPEPLLETIESSEVIAELLGHMFSNEKVESVLVSGLSVLQTLLEFKKPMEFPCFRPEGSEQLSELDQERLQASINKTLASLCPRLCDLHQVLVDPPKQFFNSMPTTLGILEPPLGNTRLQIVRVIDSIVHTNSHPVHEELAKHGTLSVILDLYFKYSWNNFLHTQVVHLITSIFSCEPEGQDKPVLLQQLFVDCSLIQKLLDSWDDNDEIQARPGGHRRGYMGHVTKICNEIVEAMEKGPNSNRIVGYIEALPGDYKSRWESFTATTLTEVNKTNTADPVGGHNLPSSNEDDDIGYRDIPFPQDNALQQAFSDYVLQQMTSSFSEQIGFNEHEFADQEEHIEAPFTDRISSIDFSIITNEESASAAMFDQVCNQRIQQFDDADSDEDIWEDKEKDFKFSQGIAHPKPFASTGDKDSEEEESSSDEEDLDSPAIIRQTPSREQKMEVDQGDAWPDELDDVAMESVPVAMDTAPLAWESGASSTAPASTDGGWAAFSDNNNPNAGQQQASEERWADFTSNVFDNSSDNTVFTTMDTNPSTSSDMSISTAVNSRTAAYAVDNEISSCKSDEKGPNSSMLENDNASLPSDPEASVASSAINSDDKPAVESPSKPSQSSADASSSEKAASTAQSTENDALHSQNDENNTKFLSSSGLMKAPSSLPDTNGPTELQEFDEKSHGITEPQVLVNEVESAESSTSQNGPV